MAVKDRDKTVRNSTFFCLYRMIHKESHRAGEGGRRGSGQGGSRMQRQGYGAGIILPSYIYAIICKRVRTSPLFMG